MFVLICPSTFYFHSCIFYCNVSNINTVLIHSFIHSFFFILPTSIQINNLISGWQLVYVGYVRRPKVQNSFCTYKKKSLEYFSTGFVRLCCVCICTLSSCGILHNLSVLLVWYWCKFDLTESVFFYQFQ